MKNKLVGINYWAGVDTVSISKFENLDDLKKKEDIVRKNKNFYVNYLECHASKIMGDRNLKKNIEWQKLSTWQKIKKMKKICIECGEWCFSCI